MRLRAAMTTAALLGAAGLAYARWEASSYRLRRISAPALPAGHDPLRLLHLSDLHLTPSRARVRSWVGSLAHLRPDLVVVTGDIISHPAGVELAVETLEPLMDVPGVFVLGSNDYFAPAPINPFTYFNGPSKVDPRRAELPWRELVDRLESMGWSHLGNSDTTVDVIGGTIAVRGVDDPHIERDDYARVAGPTQGVTVGVAHAPYRRVIDAMADDGVNLILAGHTHGGQVRMPGVGALVTNCDLDRGQARGLSRHRGAHLHVSAGLGTSPYAPLRFACPPEATLIEVIPGG